MNTDTDKHYHHGDLKEALTRGFLELLETTPMEKLSLRKLAAHVGVAATAIYNHFESKDDLLVTAKEHCLKHFAGYLDTATNNIDSAEQRIKLLGKAYFRYSVEHTRYFDFIMTENIPDALVTEELINASMQAESALRKAVVMLLEQHNLPTNQYNEGLGSFACWSVAHGISALAAKRINHAACASGRWPPEFMLSDEAQVNASFDAMTDVLVAGILHAARTTP